MYRSRLGELASAAWAHVAAVLLLDLVRADEAHYSSLVMLNANAQARLDPSVFPHARVCWIEDDRVRWRGRPPHRAGMPDGTPIVDDIG